ncbi:BREX system Lon protease-like protein BrxL, partial [Klebsiella pneumoniae]
MAWPAAVLPCFISRFLYRPLIDSSTVKAHQKLLVGGVWCIADLEYDYTEDKSASPWVLASLKPIQISRFDFDGYLDSRKQFSTDEWIDLLIQSIGFNGTVAKLAMRQPFVLFKGLTFQKLCLPGAFR